MKVSIIFDKLFVHISIIALKPTAAAPAISLFADAGHAYVPPDIASVTTPADVVVTTEIPGGTTLSKGSTQRVILSVPFVPVTWQH